LLKKKIVTARDVAAEPFILREEGSGTRQVVERAFKKRRLQLKPVLSLASPEAIKNAVSAGLGLAVVSRLIVQLELRLGVLSVVPMKDLRLRRSLHFQRLKGRTPSPALAEFLKLLGKLKAR
jgi:DNA-binding transcriptional LysR family regulator